LILFYNKYFLFKNNMPLYPKDWGPYGWKFIHIVALAYPSQPTNDDKENYKTFFTIIGKILPCHICSDHYCENLIKYPLSNTVLSSRENLLKWTIDMHNSVNQINNTRIYDYDTAIALIKNNFVETIEPEIIKPNIKPEIIKPNIEPEIIKPNIEPRMKKKNNILLYILIFLFIILIIIAIVYKKN